MADIDMDPIDEHDKMDTQHDQMGETIPLTPGGVIREGSTWEPECEQETSFGKKTQRIILLELQAEELYQKLSRITHQIPKAYHFNDFKLRNGKLY